VERADGVFLWVYLALNSLQRGSIKRDDWETLEKRLAALPSKLEDLYREMWQRHGDDVNLYRREAAFCFNLVLFINDWHDDPASIFVLSFTGSKLCKETLENTRPLPHPRELVKECERHQQRIEDICAGLLEIRVENDEYDRRRHKYMQWIRQQVLTAGKCTKNLECPHCSVERLYHFNKETRVEFIHRSAADFLRDTNEGREILTCDQINLDERDLSVGDAIVFASLAGAGAAFSIVGSS
jgi:hypothetical protein